jgi:sulfate permease, SulP family
VLRKVFPFLRWFQGYTLGSLRVDMIAGLTVALVLIPQSMAYAQLAGLPAYYGLYAAFLPPMIAALFGSSRQLATGPVAVVSLMTFASLAPMAIVGSERFIEFAILLALMVGLFQLALGVLRLGLVVNFLSHPVVNGFTNAAAIIIATSQLSKLFGVNVDTAEHHYKTIIAVIQAAQHYTHWPTFLLGALAFAIMYSLKRISPRIPNVLVAVVLTTTISWAIGFQHNTNTFLNSIQSTEARTLIADFNAAVKDITTLGNQRT